MSACLAYLRGPGGASRTAGTNNVCDAAKDRVRHLCSSLRELLTQVLHRVAPDAEVRAWSKSPEDFCNGRPTRKTRLRFICRNVADGGRFGVFVEKDIDSVLAVWKVMEAGVHEVSQPYTKRQMKALSVRIEAAIRLLLEVVSSEE